MASTTGKVNAEIILRLENLQTQMTSVSNMQMRTNAKMLNDSKKTAKATSAAWAAGFAVISVYALKMARKVIDAFGNMANVYAQFEQSLANTQSVARASAIELEAMEEAARRVGATTRSTASEAANALYYLASAGFTASESIAALDGVNALAIATNSDLASTSETVATTIRQYGLETSAATDIANTFTAAITNSLATMNKLTKSFEYVGPIAAGLGITVEETTGALQLLYNKGFSGEKAGRGLRSILVDLADATSVVNKKLGAMGIQFDEVNPATNELADIFDHLRENGVDATNAAAVFGKVSGVQLASLISVASDASGGIKELTAEVTGTSRAFEAMDIQMNTLQGSIDKFRNAEEALKITIGKELDPVLTSIVDIFTEWVKVINNLNPKVLAIITTLGTIAAVSVAAGIAVTTLSLALAAAGVTAGAALATLTAVAAPIAIVATALVGLVAISSELDKVRLTKLNEQYGELADNLGVAKEETDKFVDSADKLNRHLTAQANSTYYNKQAKSVDELRDSFTRLSSAYGLTMDQVIALAKENEEFSKGNTGLILTLENVLETEKKLEEARKKREEDRNRNLESGIRDLARFKQAEEDAEAARLESISDAQTKLAVEFARVTESSKAFGKTFDKNAGYVTAYNNAVKTLIEQDVKVDSEEYKNLVAELERLESIYGKVIFSAKEFSDEDDVITRAQEYINKLKALNESNKEVGKTEQEVLEIQRERALENVARHSEEYEAIDAYFDRLKELNQLRIDREAIDTAKEYSDQLYALSATEEELLQKERDRIVASIEASDIGSDAMEVLIEAVDELYDKLKEEAAFEEFIENFETVVDRIQDFTGAIDDFVQVSIQNQIDAEERLLQKRLDALDEAQLAEFAAAGISEKTALELAQEKIDAAITAGDIIAQQEAQDAFDRLVIQQDFDAQRLALEDQANKDIAQLNYEADLTAWAADSITAITSSALAILEGYKTGGPVGGILMGALTAIQLATIVASKPQPPKFADGGIVPGSSYKGDVTPILANAGELILNKAQQESVVDQMDNDRPIHITVQTYLDSKIVATSSAKHYRNGTVKI